MGAFATNVIRRIPAFFAAHVPDAIKSTTGKMHYIAAFAAVSAYISDFLTRLNPKYMLALGAIMAICAAVGLLALSTKTIKPGKLIAELIVFCAFTAALSLGVYVAKVYFEVDPFVTLQRSTDDHFRKTDTNVSQVDKKIQRVLDALDSDKRAQIYQLNLTMHLSIPALVMLQSQVSQYTIGLDQTKADAVFVQKADEYAGLQRQVAQTAAFDPLVRGLWSEAENALDQADFTLASVKLRQIADAEHATSLDLVNRARAHALDAAQALRRSAAIAALAFQYRTAADDFANAAKLAAPYDAHLAWQLTVARADALSRQADERGDETAAGDAAEAYRAALAMTSPSQSGDEWARSRDKLGGAIERLERRPDATARHQQAVSAYRDALRGGRSSGAQSPEGAGQAPASSRSTADRSAGTTTARHHRTVAPVEKTTGTAESAAPVAAAPQLQQEQEQKSGDFFSRLKSWVGKATPNKVESQTSAPEPSRPAAAAVPQTNSARPTVPLQVRTAPLASSAAKVKQKAKGTSQN